ncbi:MAG: asparagine synthase (glutamine-hydrolyzing) [candidate division KSB1 bacterium]|nr:asparagine synthase (glutamine-hydrolyzing) [candidate division KSB1 bacterium]
MCGICGLVNIDRSRPIGEGILKKMCDVIQHRGPDDEGYYVNTNVGLGMRRLSIIDLVTGKQPISNEDGSVWIVFNGEIYNFPQLRAELQSKGHQFVTKTDTETIVHAYEEYGEECPTRLNGMFAFAIWDNRSKRLFIARDRLGIKPLYYYFDGHRFVFGSELKSILQMPDIPRRVDPRALDNFLTFEYIPAPLSIFKDVKKLSPGHSLTLKDGQISLRRYWELICQENGADIEVICENLRELLTDAVKIRLISDVPLGAFLSGGLDSSSVVALMSRVMDRPVKTFSIGFDDVTYNELHYARIIAKHFKTEHHEFIIKPDAVELTEKLIGYLDEPFGDFSIFPTYLVSKMARDYVTVVLSGDGGDELFAGYDTYIADRLASRYQKLPGFVRKGIVAPVLNSIPPTSKKKGFINKAKRFVEGMALPEDLCHTRWMIFLSSRERDQLYAEDLKQALRKEDPYAFIRHFFATAGFDDPLNRQMYVDIKTYLVDDILVKVDRMSMATSLEARVPFLDYRFVEFAANIPSRLKLQGKQTKYILKRAMSQILPREILTRGKEGFSIPIKNWLKNELKPMMMDILSPSKIAEQGFFNLDYVEKLKDEHLRGVENHSHRLWALMMFGYWYEKYMRD